MLWWLLLVAAAIAVALYMRQRRPLYEFSKAYPIDLASYPLIGQSYIFWGTDEDRMNALIKMGDESLKNGGISTMWMGTKPYASISDPELLEVVAKACLEKDATTMKYLRLVLGNGLIFAPTKIWRPRRKVMAPTFNMKNLQEFVTVFDKQSSIMVAQLRAHDGGGDFSFWEFITAYTFDAICETVLGMELNAQKERHHLFIEAFDVLVQILAKRMLSPWLYWDWVFRLTPHYKPFITQRKIGFDFFDKVILDRRKELAERGADDDLKDRKSFLDMMIVASGRGRGYTNIELREEIISIVSAGTDTSAVGTAFVALMLSRHPRVQDKVYEELKEVFGGSDRPVTWQDLPRLRYMEAVIKETLRLYPPAPVVVRDVHETVVLPNGATLRPGMGLVLHFWATHRNTKYWGDDVEEFRPERFLEGPLKHPAQFAAFSYSLRNCIGGNYAIMSTKTNLSNLLRRYEVLPPLSVPPDQLLAPFRVKFDVMMKHCDNFELRIRSRHNGRGKK
ncbi:cytochrome P450 4d8-like [Cydia fagiglandana]|uniref:cytochrome P450 4d8-like n=1 Tax=Cydia fagiglandana TaxID=1458189 RepID=UPI002FEDF2C9